MNILDRIAKYGEPLQWTTLASFLPVILIWENVDMPTGSIFWWGIPAFVVATIGFLLNGRHIKNEGKRRLAEFETMKKRHAEMLERGK
jgi:hypothetical protein